jgi:hypothetical protein
MTITSGVSNRAIGDNAGRFLVDDSGGNVCVADEAAQIQKVSAQIDMTQPAAEMAMNKP